MKLFKNLFTIFLILSLSSIANSQKGMQLLYENSTYKISQFVGKTNLNSNLKHLYIRLGNINTNSQNESYRYFKYDRSNSSWFLPLNGFLEPAWYYHFKWNTWIVNGVSYFAQYDYDTNNLIKYSRMFVFDIIYDKIEFTNDGGLSSSPAYYKFNSNICGFDIDTSYEWSGTSYYLGINFPNTGYIKKVVNHGGGSFDDWDLDIIPRLSHINPGFLKINPFRKNYIYTVADNMMLSTESGYYFFSINIPRVKELLFYDENKVYGYTSSKIYTSNNSGLNWDSAFTQIVFNDIEIDPNNSSRLYGGSDSGLYVSTNNGISWNLYNNAFTPSKKVIGISKDKNSGDTVFVSTDLKVYKIWQSYITSINHQFQFVKEFELHQNFPNPFNPTTKINYSIPTTQYTILKVYDILGNEVITLVNEKQNAGSYSVEFDARNYPSGIYYYKLEAGDFSEVKKMILIK